MMLTIRIQERFEMLTRILRQPTVINGVGVRKVYTIPRRGLGFLYLFFYRRNFFI